MKTTIDLPDDLLIAAKKRAAETRSTLREIISSGLRREMARKPDTPRPVRRLKWVTVRGGLPPGLDLSDRERMHVWLDRNR
jgi:hypothetical protein